MILLLGRRIDLTHVFDPCWNLMRDYRQREIKYLLRQEVRKTRDKNLSKNRSTQILENRIQSGLEWGENPKTAEKLVVLDDPF